MNISDYYLALALSVVVSLLIEEYLGVSTGGMIVPGVLASYIGHLDIIIYIFLLSLITYFLVDRVLSRYVMIYGKRKFTYMILVAIILKLLGDQLYPLLPFASVAFRGVGIISPALLANTYSKQGISFTIPSAIISTFIVYAVMTIVFLF